MHKACNVPTDERDRPLEPVKILNSGSMVMKEPFVVEKASAKL